MRIFITGEPIIRFNCESCGKKSEKKRAEFIRCDHHFCSVACRTKKGLGQYIRKNRVWSPPNTDDGYIDSSNRFRVYLPNHPRAGSTGYVLRSIVHYEYFNKERVNNNEHIHHMDKNRLNDSPVNLIKMINTDHMKMHNPRKRIVQHCLVCDATFLIKPFLKNSRKYCSQKCFHHRVISQETKDKVSSSCKITTWSRNYDVCIKCHTNALPYAGKGLCKKCYQQKWRGG